MNERYYHPKGKVPQDEKGFKLEPDTHVADVVRQFAETSYEHQPGYFGSIEFSLVERTQEHPSPRADDSEVTQPYSIN